MVERLNRRSELPTSLVRLLGTSPLFNDVPWDNSSPAPFEGVRSWCKSKRNNQTILLLLNIIGSILDSDSRRIGSNPVGATILMHPWDISRPSAFQAEVGQGSTGRMLHFQSLESSGAGLPLRKHVGRAVSHAKVRVRVLK